MIRLRSSLLRCSAAPTARICRPLATSVFRPRFFSSSSSASTPHSSVNVLSSGSHDLQGLPFVEFPLSAPEQKAYSILPDWFTDHLPIEQLTDMMQFIHVQLHVPWWLTLMTTTVALRIALTPSIIFHLKSMAQLGSYRLWLYELWKKGKHDALTRQVRGWGFLAFFKNVRRHLKDDGFSFARFLVLPVTTFPAFVSYAVALRKSFALDPSFQTGGILWFKDLTIPDSNCMLALACTVTSLLAIHISAKPIPAKGEIAQSVKTNPLAQFFQVVTICFFPVLTYINSGLLLYWLTSSLFGIGINTILRTPAARALIGLNIPPKALTPTMQDYSRYLAQKQAVTVDYSTIKSRQRSRR